MLFSGLTGGAGGSGARTAHVIVCGNEKGGSGKSTTAMHIAVGLLKAGRSVATIDLDGRQQTLSRYLDCRRDWALKTGARLASPRHFSVPPARHDTITDAEGEEFQRFAEGLDDVGSRHDFLVIDTPGSDSFLNRLAHRMADTLVTPVNDSFVDLDVLARVDAASGEVHEAAPYARSVLAATRERRQADGAAVDWVVVRNRVAPITSRNERKVDASLRRLARRLGFRLVDGIGERTIFREFFPLGLTAIDDLDEQVLGARPTLSHLAARQEVRRLIEELRLPAPAARRRTTLHAAPG